MLHSLNARLFFAVIAVCVLPCSAFSDDAAVTRLHSFTEKVGASVPASDSTGRAASAHSVMSQFQAIEGSLKQRDYERARQSISSLPLYVIPPDLQGEWADVSKALIADIDKSIADARELLRKDVDQLVNDVRSVCLSAKASPEFDPLLLRCGALQLRRPSGQDALAQRLYEKVSGCSATLEHMARFLDFRAKGFAKLANNALRELVNNSTNFPVLSVDDIKSKMLPIEEAPTNLRDALRTALEGLKTPDDLPAALEQVRKMIATADSSNGVVQGLRSEEGSLQLLKAAWEATKNGDDQSALQSLAAAQRSDSSISMDGQPFHGPIRQTIMHEALSHSVHRYIPIDSAKGETLESYLDRALDELSKKQEFAGMLDVMKNAETWLEPNMGESTFGLQRAAIERFLAGRRFETADDPLAALNEYRFVMTVTGKHVPIKEAQDGLERVKQKHPEALTNYEGAVLQELHALREQMQIQAQPMQIYSPGRPGRPNAYPHLGP